jgi:protein-disulfide isomerase
VFTKKKRIVLSTLMICFAGLLACSQAGQSKNNEGPVYIKKDAPNPEAAAKIFGKDVSLSDLEKATPEIFSARQELYEAQKNAVDEQVRQMTMEELGKKEKLSSEEFVKKEMEASKKKVGEKEVNAFLKERNVADPDKVPAHLKDQVRGILHMQALVQSYTKKNPVEIYLKRPQAPKIDFDLSGNATWGKEDAKVTVIEFSDFQCPFCSKGKERVQELKKEYGKKIRIVFKHLPLPMHPDARGAAEASACVQEQDMDKFWKFHDMLFDNQKDLGVEKLKEYAKKVGADVKKFDECFAAKKYAALVDRNMEEARKYGVNSTPTFYVNNQPVRGARDLSEFRELIDEALK